MTPSRIDWPALTVGILLILAGLLVIGATL